MEIKTKLGVITNSFKFSSTNTQPVTTGTDHSNWGFTYDTTNIDAPGTIFFSSTPDEIYGESYIKNVIINSKGPVVLEDMTNYVAISEPWNIKITFKSDDFIDLGNLKIELDDDGQTIPVFIINRSTGEVPNSSVIKDVTLNKNDEYYTLSFILDQSPTTLRAFGVNNEKELAEYLSNHQFKISLYDISGNEVEFSTSGKWHYIGNVEDVNLLKPLIIEFYDIKPTNKILKDNVEGSTWVKIINPNYDWWVIRPEIELAVDSVGKINPASWNWNDYAEQGVVTFQIFNIDTRGIVTVNSWLNITNSNIAAAVKNATYVSNSLEFKFIDAEGRKIKIKPYVPKYLNDEEYFKFISFTEDFLNTMYESLSNNKNISILEKTARIGNFNVIDQLEKQFMHHYINEFGIEIQPNIDDCQNFLLQKRSNNSFSYDNISDDDIYEFMRFVYHEIPAYNQYKGSYTGVRMALNVLGLSIKLVELWSKIDSNDLDDMIRQDEINDDPFNMSKYDTAEIAKYYLTSRFDADMLIDKWTFTEFNNVANNIIKLIMQCKPVTRTLRKLTKIWYDVFELKNNYIFLPYEHKQPFTYFNYTFDLLNDFSIKKHKYTTNKTNINGINTLHVPFNAIMAYSLYKPTIAYDPETTSPKKSYSYDFDAEYVLDKTCNQTYNVLHNIANNIKNSSLKLFKFILKNEYTDITETGVITYKTANADGKITNNDNFSWNNNKPDTKVISEEFNEASFVLNLFDKYANQNDNFTIIDSDEIGFYIKINGIESQKFNSFPKTIFNTKAEVISFELSNIENIGDDTYTATLVRTTRKDNKLYLNTQFDIPLGSHYITQGLSEWNNPFDKENITCKIINDDPNLIYLNKET